jgi:hypothetical protein
MALLATGAFAGARSDAFFQFLDVETSSVISRAFLNVHDVTPSFGKQVTGSPRGQKEKTLIERGFDDHYCFLGSFILAPARMAGSLGSLQQEPTSTVPARADSQNSLGGLEGKPRLRRPTAWPGRSGASDPGRMPLEEPFSGRNGRIPKNSPSKTSALCAKFVTE